MAPSLWSAYRIYLELGRSSQRGRGLHCLPGYLHDRIYRDSRCGLMAAQWGEKTGCFTNVDRTVHLTRKTVEPPGEANSGLEVYLDFPKRMDFRCMDGSPLTPWT